MTSKTFKGFASDRELTVKGYDDGSQVELLVRRAATGLFTAGIAIAPSDAPALALAILEAAGYEERQKSWDVLNSADENFAQAMRCLSKGLELQERATAEARERAELEAEALELCNAAIRQEGYVIHDSFSQIPTPDLWLAVARRARELAKGATK